MAPRSPLGFTGKGFGAGRIYKSLGFARFAAKKLSPVASRELRRRRTAESA